MRTFQSLIVIATALALPSCTVYMHGDSPHGPYSGPGHACTRGGYGEGVIGLSIGRAGDAHRGPLVVERVAPDSPAGDANIRPGDRIRAVDGESTRGMTVSEAGRLIRGRPDTAVELRVDSPRGSRLMTLVRVPEHAIWGGRGPCHAGGHHRPCDRGGRGYEMPAPDLEASPADEPPAPEQWPPTKPGHHIPD